jgi:hypothetical protein
MYIECTSFRSTRRFGTVIYSIRLLAVPIHWQILITLSVVMLIKVVAIKPKITTHFLYISHVFFIFSFFIRQSKISNKLKFLLRSTPFLFFFFCTYSSASHSSQCRFTTQRYHLVQWQCATLLLTTHIPYNFITFCVLPATDYQSF